MSITSQTKQRIDDSINNSAVFVVAKSWCPHSARTKHTLEYFQVEADIFDIDLTSEEDAIQDYLASLTGQHSVPSIFIKGKHVGGNADFQALSRRGDLKKLLAADRQGSD